MQIKKFFNLISDQFPELSYKQIENICLSSFKYVRYIFDEGTLDEIQIKHLGKFRVVPARVKAIKHRLLNTSYGEMYNPEKRAELLNKIEQYELQHPESK